MYAAEFATAMAIDDAAGLYMCVYMCMYVYAYMYVCMLYMCMCIM